MTGIFIKGAWINLRSWEEDYHKYFCCPEYHKHVTAREIPPGSHPFGYRYIKIYSCALAGMREIGAALDEDFDESVKIPDWCPLKEGRDERIKQQ